MKKRRLKKNVKKYFVLIILLLITGLILITYKPKEKVLLNKEEEKIDYLSLVTNKLNEEDSEFIKWVSMNYKDSMEKMYKQLEQNEYSKSLWHEVTGNSYIVLNDLYTDKYDEMDNITILEDSNKESVTLSFIGDVSLADNWYIIPEYDKRGKGVYGILSEDVVDVMNKSDLMTVNSEFTVSNRGSAMKGKLYTFRAKPERLSIYNEMGVDLVTLANNHVYDFGENAFLDMLKHFDDMKMPRIGAGKNLEEASRPYYFIINGYKYAFLNSTRAEKYILTPGAEANQAGVFRSYDTTRMVNKIKEVRETADYVINLVHFGKEDHHELEKEQINSAKEFIDAGSDAVIGHHAHTLQGFEFYKDRIIAYNLGDFIFNNEKKDTALFQIKVDNSGNFEYYILPAQQKDEYTKFLEKDEKQRVIKDLNTWSVNANIDNEGKITKK